jgi:serine/threonine protein kinase
MFLDSLTGQSLGQYHLRELMGVGGMGAVYRGYQESLHREVAVKVIFMRQTSDMQYEERFSREARLAGSLEHTHIVPVYDFGTEHGVSFVVMRLLSGGSLSERIVSQNGTLLPLPEVARITSGLASALQYAHDRGIIHRDIKSSNVMFDDRDTVFLVDFGIAKMAAATTHITDTGVKIGTPEFMAPELWLNEPITPAVDQYSLAILVYYMLTGSLPFKGEMPYQLMHSHLHEQPTPLLHWRDDLPGNLMEVLERALSKDPTTRYPNVEAFANAFDQAVRDSINGRALAKPIIETIVLPSPQEAPRRKMRWPAIAAVALVIAAVGIIAALASGAGRGDVTAADLPTASATALLVAQATEEPSATHTATDLPTTTNTPTDLPTSTDTPTVTPSATDVPTSTPTQTATSTETPAPTVIAMAALGDPSTISRHHHSIRPQCHSGGGHRNRAVSGRCGEHHAQPDRQRRRGNSAGCGGARTTGCSR